ncbi:FliM/FliN family flagellar motor switch protein [Roseovarius sp.]|uniref:FliM/FliN family flagellar motor switch protein n=1 Tax=Roseovarius sp. TaxID=1486281 RepID=UPI003BAAD086
MARTGRKTAARAMSGEERNSVIHRKAASAREDFDARAMSPSKALRLSLEKCGDRLFRLALTVGTLEQRRLTHAAVKEEVGADTLILLLDGQGGARGAALLDLQFAQALVEVQTMGRVRPGAAPDRPLTGTDAAIAAPLVDAMLTGFDDTLAEAETGHRPLGFRFGDRVGDARGLLLALEAADYELFRLTVDIGGGARTGILSLILPAAVLARPEPGSGEAGEGAAFDLGQLAMQMPVTLDAVLDRVQLSLAEVCALQPGMTLPVGTSAIGRTELVASGHVAAQGRLGQMNGMRAVRLTGAGEEAAPPRATPEPALAPTPPDPDPAPGFPDLSGLAASEPPTLTALPDLPDLPATGGGLPDLPDLPGEGGDGGLPDLPALADLK